MVSWDTRMLPSSGYSVFSHPEICSGDQSRISLLVTILCSFSWMARRHGLGRKADFQAWSSASLARYTGRPPWRATSRLTVDAARSRPLAISRIDEPEAIPREMSSRSASVSASSDRRRAAGTIHRVATSESEWTNAPYRMRVRSHATSVPPSNGTICRSSAPQKAPPDSLGS